MKLHRLCCIFLLLTVLVATSTTVGCSQTPTEATTQPSDQAADVPESAAVMADVAQAADPLDIAFDEEPQADFDPKAYEQFQKLTTYLGDLEALSVEARVTVRFIQGEESDEVTTTYRIDLQRPTEMTLDIVEDGNVELAIVSSGGDLTVYIAERDEYIVQPAPPAPAQVIGSVGGSGPMQIASILLAETLNDTPFEMLLNDVTAMTYIGEEEVEGQKAHRIRIVNPQITWDAWVADGDTPRPLRMKPDTEKLFGDMTEATLDIDVAFAQWNDTPDFGEEAFIFTPPEGAEKVDSFEADSGNGAEALEGQPAPDFTLPLLDGGEVTLSDLEGKVVVLDFWATWCAPCRRGLPIVIDAVKSMADQGVVLYGVNQQESREKIEEFLKEEKLDFTVALDEAGDAGKLYTVSGIPQTVIINAQGVVSAVHVGLVPQEAIEADLEKAISETAPSAAE